MPVISLNTLINAPLEKCFDLSRSIDLHTKSMRFSKEEAIAGRTSGLIELSESVTWKAKHLGFNFEMTNKITSLSRPLFFIDEMIEGPFKKLKHTHQFEEAGMQTRMTDVFEYKSPAGIFGRLAEVLFLNAYMKKLLLQRNRMIKFEAEKRP